MSASRPQQQSLFTFTIPEGARLSSCRACGKPLYFVAHERTGRVMPLNEDGTSHFADCPEAASFRRKK